MATIKYYLILLPLLLYFTNVKAENIILSTQAEVDAASLLGSIDDLTITDNGSSDPIVDLSPLSGGSIWLSGSLRIVNTPQLIDLSGLSGFLGTSSNVEIENNSALTSLDGLVNLSAIDGDLFIINNPLLVNIDALSGAFVYSIAISNNASLVNLSINGPAISSIPGGLDIYDNENLSQIDLTGFGNMHDLKIENNPNLIKISNLQGFYSLEVKNNPVLVDIDVDINANILSYTGSNLTIENNLMLSDCCIFQNPLLSLSANNVSISGNATGCNSSSEILLNDDCEIIVHAIEGRTYLDFDGNCALSANDLDQTNVLVQASSTDHTYSTFSDSSGFYRIFVVDTGYYEINSVVNSPYISSCNVLNTVHLTNTDSTETITVDLFSSVDYLCPQMEVDVTAPVLRECFDNDFYVFYCNNGTDIGTAAYIELELHDSLTIVSSGLSYTGPDVNNIYTFQLGDIAVGECGYFDINVQLPCYPGNAGGFLGQTFCVDAHIYPDSICLPPSVSWDGSSTQVTADCVQDSVYFRILNVGQGDMQNPRPFYVIEDQVMFYQENYQLNSGEEFEIAFFAGGGTFRLEAEQAVGHPGMSEPSVVVEGCGNVSAFNLGLFNQFPLDDANAFVSSECIEVTGSYDPNDKQGVPKGYGEEHYIEKNTDIEYLVRFQNTGTDTAFTVVIKDVLSPFLDVTTFNPLSSNHSYTFVIEDSLLTFTFDDILLVDSFTNETASHGFIKYRISQLPNLPIDTQIDNTAKIYFDFNPPIITNTTLHTVGENFIEINLIDNVAEAYGIEQILVYPNPSNADIFIDMEDIQGDVFIRMFDAFGREVLSREMNTFPFRVETEGLSSGIYFFEIIVNNQKLGTGKVSLF